MDDQQTVIEGKKVLHCYLSNADQLSSKISTTGQETEYYGGCALQYLSIGGFKSGEHTFAWDNGPHRTEYGKGDRGGQGSQRRHRPK
uniref:Uncharacterized protein n=1 Tax=Arundo donax TaxID=35708 RepID=A0A0A9A2G0_ARUDO